MPFQVYDYRTDITNVLVTPEIRARFMTIAVGEMSGGPRPGDGHSHDLGHEIFMILQGQAEFEIDGDTHVVGPGQMCYALVGETHTVRNVGDEEVIMYLSVTPHIQPTHTYWEESGEQEPPRFQPSRTYDVPEDTTTSNAALVALHVAMAQALALGAQEAADEQEAQAPLLMRGLRAGDDEAIVAAREAMWQALLPMYQSAFALAEVWNALTHRTEDRKQ